MQQPLANARGVLNRYLEKHNEIAAALQKDMPEVEVGTEQQQAIRAAAKTWQGPLRAVVKCLRGTGFVYVQCHIYDRNGNRVDNPGLTLSGRRFFRLPDGLPDYNPSEVIPLSNTAREFARLFFTGNQVAMRDGSFGLSQSAYEVLTNPTKFDPLSFYLSETIIGYGKGSGLQIVAAIDERMIVHLQSETPTLSQVAVSLFYSDDIHPHLEEGWLTISRSRLPFQGFDYAVLERLFAAAKNRTLTLAEMIDFANSAPPSAISEMASVYASLLLRDGMFEPDLRTGLLAFGAFSAQEREKLMRGETLVFSTLGREAQLALQNSLFFRNSQSVDVAPTYLERNPGSPVWLPSDIVPNGIPPQARITLRSTVVPQALPTPKDSGRLAGSVTSPRWMAIYATTKASGVIPKYDNFWVGERIDYNLNVQVTPEITMTLKFYENKISMSGEKYNIQTAPKPFKDAYDKTVEERIRLQGGGG
jgi:hypothetical protein